MRVRGDRVPEDDLPLCTDLIKDVVDDGPGGFFPWSWALARPPVRVTPAQQIELAGEGDARPAHPLIAGGLADREHIRLVALLEIAPQIGEPNRRRIGDGVGTGLADLVEGGADGGRREVREQGVDRD